jgi:hypothetical protein
MRSWKARLCTPAQDVTKTVELRGPTTARELKETVSSLFPGNPAVGQVRLLSHAQLLQDDDVIEEETPHEPVVVYVVVPRVKRDVAPVPAAVPAPAAAARASPPRVNVAPQPVAPPGPAAGAGAAAAVPGNAPPAQPAPVNRLKVGLLFRLAALVLLLVQGGDATRAACLCFGAFLLYIWSSRSFQLPAVGQAAGPGSWRAEAHDLVVPFLLSLNPTWRTDVFLGQRMEQVVIPEEDEEEEQ